MRLINPGPGEYCDRLSILALKIAYGTDQGRSVDHFQKEWAVILPKLTAGSLHGPFLETYTQLVVVNARLWREEDVLREYRQAGRVCVEAAEVAFGIQALNDERARLVQLINQATGNHVGEEKISPWAGTGGADVD